ncbi:serine-rich adhesin for platelets-like [Littorina saxatilis]|uniref:serine-rich adhesin for platelets-like n=1 Tax=Littorina saxatilis TaxID=31220 RepID=UPI0038B4FC6B
MRKSESEGAKDPPVQTNTAGNPNPTSPGQGKENLRSDYHACVSNTGPPASLLQQKLAQRVVRTELGGSFLGHSHLRRIQLLLDQGGSKSHYSPALKSSHSAADNASAENHQTSQLPGKALSFRRTNGRSEVEGIAQEESDTDGTADSQDASSETLESAGVACAGQVSASDTSPLPPVTCDPKNKVGASTIPARANRLSCEVENKHLSKVDNAPIEHESSEDGVLLLSTDDSDVAGDHSKLKETFTFRRDRSRMHLEISNSETTTENSSDSADSLQKQQIRPRRKVSLQEVISALTRSDESDADDSADYLDAEGSLSPLEQPSYRSKSSRDTQRRKFSSKSLQSSSKSLQASSSILQSSSSSRVLSSRKDFQTSSGVSHELSKVSQPSKKSGRVDETKEKNIYVRLKKRFGIVEQTEHNASQPAPDHNKRSCNESPDRSFDLDEDQGVTDVVADDSLRVCEAEESQKFSSPLSKISNASEGSQSTLKQGGSSNVNTKPNQDGRSLDDTRNPNIYMRLKKRFGLLKQTLDSEKKPAVDQWVEKSSRWGKYRNFESDSSEGARTVAREDPPEVVEVEESEEFLSPLSQVSKPSNTAQSSPTVGRRAGNGMYPHPKKRLFDFDSGRQANTEKSPSSSSHQSAIRENRGAPCTDFPAKSKDLSHTGFSSASFFRKKPVQASNSTKNVSPKLKKSKVIVISSDSDFPEDALPISRSGISGSGPLEGRTGIREGSGSDSDDVLLSEVKRSVVEDRENEKCTRGRQKTARPTDSGDKHIRIRIKTELKEKTQRKEKGAEKYRQENFSKSKFSAHSQAKDEVLDISDIPLGRLKQSVTKPSKTDTTETSESDDVQIAQASLNGKAGQKPHCTLLKMKRKKSKVLATVRRAESETRFSPFSMSPPVSPVVKKSAKQCQQALTGKRQFSEIGARHLEKSVYSLSESTEEDEAVPTRNHKFKPIFPKQITSSIGMNSFTNGVHHNLWDHSSSDTESVTMSDDGSSVSGELRTLTEEHAGLPSSMPWRAVPYRGETLKYPVIKLVDVQPPPDALHSRKETSSASTKGRNVFEFLQSSAKIETEGQQLNEGGVGSDHTDSDSSPVTVKSSVSSPLSVSPQKRRILSCTECRNIIDMLQPATLDASRTELKKQRTVKKIAPKLCTTLKLRKQPSPNKSPSSSEMEWAVVSQDSDWTADDLHHDDSIANEESLSSRMSKKKAKSRKRKAPSGSSSDEDDQPLKKRRSPAVRRSDKDSSSSSEEDFEEQPPVKKIKKRKVMVESSDDDDAPLKPRDITAKVHGKAETDSDRDDATPLKIKKAARGRKTRVQLESSDEEDVPLKPKSARTETKDESAEEDSEEDVASEGDNDNATPVKRKVSPKVAKLTSESSCDDDSPVKVNRKKSKPDDDQQDSDLDTSSLSSDGENEAPVQTPQRFGPNIETKTRESEENGKQKTKSKQDTAPSTDKGETPYLKRLRVICRKVGIFVRNDIHFLGCTTDNQKIERLKEALKKAGMKGQPSLSKVDSVNLKREAEALDTTNIIETQGRPKRQPKDVFTRTHSPKKLLTPIKEQFSRIRDLISDSDSD